MSYKSLSSYLVYVVILSGVFWSACGPKPPTGPTAEELAAIRAQARQDSVQAAEAAARVAREAEEARRAAAERREAEEEARRQAEEARQRAAEERRMAMLSTIYFDYDKSMIRDNQRTALDENARKLREFRPTDRVLIEGHADERGTIEYNLALGERRANTIKKYLMDAGVADGRISTISFGEERAADNGHNESAWSKNRRAELKRQ